MVTANVIHRTFHILRATSRGTAFTLDRGGRQYLVTARHVVEGIVSGESISILHGERWDTVYIEVVGIGKGDVDVAVLSCPQQLSPMHPLEPTSAGLVYGQQAYFLGFPFGWDGGGASINHDRPLPFVKAGVISALGITDPIKMIYIDSHVNAGFSGGPVVFSRPGKQQNVLFVAGVVVGYPKCFQPVYDACGHQVAQAQENPGLVMAVSIEHVVELIDANPIGFALPH